MKLCSACLLGLYCRYNGKIEANNKILQLAKKEILLPICPEQICGLSTPREPCEIVGDRVVTRSGKDVTEKFLLGAKEVLKIAQLYDITEVILKQRSPSCGCGEIYDGSFSRKIIHGNGVTAKFLIENGIKVFSEDEF
jgi:uncharacterized protein YbbK (DUF523 family)